jgi:hypothetical protein
MAPAAPAARHAMFMRSVSTDDGGSHGAWVVCLVRTRMMALHVTIGTQNQSQTIQGNMCFHSPLQPFNYH